MATYINIAQILVAIVLIGVLLLQVKGGGLGGIFGQADTTYKVRRGVERTLFRFTIALASLFIILAIVNLQFLD